MSKHDLCCIGHITLDKVVTTENIRHMPGGTSFYFSHAIRHLNGIDYKLVTALAESEMQVVDDLRSKNVNVDVKPSRNSVYFENIYSENQDDRTQRVLAKADPFVIDHLKDTEAKIFHLGALLADDFSIELIEYLSKKGLVSIDSQGYLREVRNQNVYATDWKGKEEALQYVHFLKADKHELEALTGQKDITKGAELLHQWGVKEVLVTLGSQGSVIFNMNSVFKIPAYVTDHVVDATGCGDTYTAGYLYKRVQNAGIEEAGCFAAALATIKIETLGPFSGIIQDVEERIRTSKTRIPII